jgi:hemerythrin-like domain-containing protein
VHGAPEADVTVRSTSSRRDVVRDAVGIGVAALLAGCAKPEPVAKPRGEDDDDRVTVAEDLMREHGVLKRVLLVYEDAARRLDASGEIPTGPLQDAATLVRTFIEGYHEKLEEDHLFPRFRRANVLVGLVDVLEAQHEAGRRLTQETIALSTRIALGVPEGRVRLARTLRAFVRMYAPHEAREDTVLFPALHRVVSPSEYAALGDQFESKERALFGQGGFERSVERIASIEKAFGLDDLASFTPKE